QEYKWSSMREYVGTEIQLVDKDTKEQIMNDFISEADFLNFHDIEDETDYLEITEEVIEEKEKRAKKIIAS
ncbi:MAG: hypothetical protein JM58_15380, partial [Peptococcaceae bacterium BICA1-8]